MLTEAKANLIYAVARNYLEKKSPRVKVTEEREEATLESARAWDQNQGNFKEALTDYYSIISLNRYPLKPEPERMRAYFGVSQQLINLNCFGQVREWLKIPNTFHLEEMDEAYFEAKRQEQLGWIADYEMGFFESQSRFLSSIMKLEGLGRERWRMEEKVLYSTDTHFLSRAYFGLGSFGINPIGNFDLARKGFEEALKLDQEHVADHPEDVAKLAYGKGWIARCEIRAGQLNAAYFTVHEAKKLFEQSINQTGRKGLSANADLLWGEFELKHGYLDEAVRDFRSALEIRKERGIEPYPKGLADAYLGLAQASWKGHHPFQAYSYFKQAVKAHPQAALRGFVGL